MPRRKAEPAHQRIQVLLGLSLDLREDLLRARPERLQCLFGTFLDVVANRLCLIEEVLDDLPLILADQLARLLASSSEELLALGLEISDRLLNLSKPGERRRFRCHLGNPPCRAFGKSSASRAEC